MFPTSYSSMSMSTITITIQRFSPAAAFCFFFIPSMLFRQLLSKFYFFPFHVHFVSSISSTSSDHCYDDPHTHTHGWYLVCIYYNMVMRFIKCLDSISPLTMTTTSIYTTSAPEIQLNQMLYYNNSPFDFDITDTF